MGSRPAVAAGVLALGLGGIVLVSPGPAAADDVFNGTYTYWVTEETDRGAAADISAIRTWTITPCGPGCAHVSGSADQQAGGSGPYDGNLQLVDGVWRMTVSRPDLSVCNDGRHMPGAVSYSVDPATLTGTANGTLAADCDGAPGGFQDTFMLTKT